MHRLYSKSCSPAAARNEFALTGLDLFERTLESSSKLPALVRNDRDLRYQQGTLRLPSACLDSHVTRLSASVGLPSSSISSNTSPRVKDLKHLLVLHAHDRSRFLCRRSELRPGPTLAFCTSQNFGSSSKPSPIRTSSYFTAEMRTPRGLRRLKCSPYPSAEVDRDALTCSNRMRRRRAQNRRKLQFHQIPPQGSGARAGRRKVISWAGRSLSDSEKFSSELPTVRSRTVVLHTTVARAPDELAPVQRVPTGSV